MLEGLLALTLAVPPQVEGFILAPEPPGISRLEKGLLISAGLADLISTEIAVSKGRTEANPNPVMQTTVGRVIMISIATIGVIKAVDWLKRHDLKPLAWLVMGVHVGTRAWAVQINLS